MRVALIGGTGLIGAQLADRLIDAGHEVDALVRRPTGRTAVAWREHVAPADEWPHVLTRLRPDAAVSALGTTMRMAGSREAFRAVDHDAIVGFASAVRQAGARQMLLVSSVGANAASRTFYLRVKGQTEAALRDLSFERLDIFRPGLLLGARGGPPRPGERLAIALSPLANLLLKGRLDRYAAVRADVVADAMLAVLGRTEAGTFVHGNRAILALARR
jgi:uncharacterized protein YbjT (DUF2867 family)